MTARERTSAALSDEIYISLLTGGGDRPYVFGLVGELLSKGVTLDLIGSDDLDFLQFRDNPRLKFLNLRGDQRPDVPFKRKPVRVLKYYARLIRYALTAKPRIFHILWNNKFQFLDRTLLTLYYKLLGKSIVLTIHNVNAGIRDSKDTFLNRVTLRIQYRLADHVFVHTDKMKRELIQAFQVRADRVTVIPFGINNAVPNTSLTPLEARQRLGIPETAKTLLFFGNIVPYKGLDYLVTAFQRVLAPSADYRLIIAGCPGNDHAYWAPIRDGLTANVQTGSVVLKSEFIQDNDIEVYFKAANVLVLPYRHIYQSGVLFLGYSFGLPVLASDVGSMRDEVATGKTGFLFNPNDPTDLAKVIQTYFRSDLYLELPSNRQKIRAYANQRNSWDTVGRTTIAVYAHLQRPSAPRFEQQNASLLGRSRFKS